MTLEHRRAAWAKLTAPERAALMRRGFNQAEANAFDGAERTALLVFAARLAAPAEDVRSRAADRLATAWRRYLAVRWSIDQHTAPPQRVETLHHALHRLTVYWSGRALEADTIARFLRYCYDSDRMK